MPDSLFVHSLRFSPARDRSDGLLGFTSFKIGRLIVDGVAVRRTQAGAITLSFPERTDSNGQRRAIVRPLDQAARDAITEQVVTELRRQGRLA